MDPTALTALLHDWGYPAFLALLCATAFGSPIPEDLLLLSGGYLITAGVFSWPTALTIAVVGVVTSDFIVFTFGRRMRRASHDHTGKIVSTSRLARFASWFERVGSPAVFIARLVPGTRAVVFITAGLHGVRPLTFLFFDVAGALLWAPLLVWVGAELGEEIGGLADLMKLGARLAFWIVAGALLLLFAWRFWRTEESKL